jgi:hypothetical protein
MAAILMTAHLDMNLQQLLNVLAQQLSADPGSPQDGQFWYRTDIGEFRIRTNGATKTLGISNDADVVHLAGDETITGLKTFSQAPAVPDASIPIAKLVGLDTAISDAIADVVNAAPTQLDTLKELADALGDDANFATTVNTALGMRVRQYAANIGDGTTTQFTLTHGLAASEDVNVVVRQAAGNKEIVLADWRVLSTTQVRVDFNTAPSTNQYRVIVRGL